MIHIMPPQYCFDIICNFKIFKNLFLYLKPYNIKITFFPTKSSVLRQYLPFPGTVYKLEAYQLNVYVNFMKFIS